jgi:transcriptional regulator GlxA family with amidase domain
VLDPARPVHRLEPVDHWRGELESFVALPRPRSRSERELEVCRFLYVLTSMLERSQHEPTWLERAHALLGSNLGEGIDLRAVAEELGMRYETFRKRFARETGTSPARYRSTRRMEVARELLDSTSMSHREIAATLGFGDEFHFSKRFKQWSGVAPMTVRRGDWERAAG